MKINLTDEEVVYLHDLILHELDSNEMPECTWDDDCFSCNLYQKIYDAFVSVRDG